MTPLSDSAELPQSYTKLHGGSLWFSAKLGEAVRLDKAPKVYLYVHESGIVGAPVSKLTIKPNPQAGPIVVSIQVILSRDHYSSMMKLLRRREVEAGGNASNRLILVSPPVSLLDDGPITIAEHYRLAETNLEVVPADEKFVESEMVFHVEKLYRVDRTVK